MTTTKLTLLFSALCFSTAVAEEYELKRELFEQTLSVQGIGVSGQAVELSINPEIWGDLPVLKVIPQGTKVAKGDKLVWVDTQKVDQYIAEQELQRELDTLKLATAQRELAELEINTERTLAAAKLKFERQTEDYQRYLKQELPDAIASTKFDAEKSQWNLEYTQEELRQLLKMYEADGIAEDTEEIILQRTRNTVKNQEFRTDKVNKAVQTSLDVLYPREEADQKWLYENAKLALEFTQNTLPQALEVKKQEVAKLAREDQKKADDLVKVKADRAAMEITAPVDGLVYFGFFEGSNWQRKTAMENLKPGGKVPLKEVFMTLVPESGSDAVAVSTDSFTAKKLVQGMTGLLSIPTSPWKTFPADVEKVSLAPNIYGTWDVVLNPKLDQSVKIPVGESVSAKFVAYQKQDALSIPAKAVTQKSDGSYVVNLKMADDQQQEVAITVGESNSTNVEVLSGLTEGQVIIYSAS